MNEKQITKEFLLDLITQYKTSEKELQAEKEEQKKWQERKKLAIEQGREDLAAGAAKKSEQCGERVTSIHAHLAELGAEIRKARTQLKGLSLEPELSIDAEALLASLENLTGGTADPVSDEFREVESDEALRSLKEEMNRNSGESGK